MADATGALRRHLPHVGGGLHELVASHRDDRRQARLRPCLHVDRAIEAALAGDDHPFGEVAQHRVGGPLEAAPRAVAGGTALLHPHDLAAQQEAQVVLQDRGDVGGQGAIGAAAEVGDVDSDAATRLEHAGALGEHVAQHLQVGHVVGRDVPLAQLGLVRLAGEVGRRGDHQGDAGVGHVGHVAGVTEHDLVDHLRRVDLLVVGDHRRLEPFVERRRVVPLTLAHPEGRRGGAAARRRVRRPRRSRHVGFSWATARSIRCSASGAMSA